jgi:hypothetical protein
MSRIATVCLALALLAGAFGSARAQSEAGAQSLLFAPGARAEGMARAGVALANDANAIWWNVGALAFVRGHDVSASYYDLVAGLAEDVNYTYLAYVQRVEGLGGLGGTVTYLNYGKSEATDIDGNVIQEFNSYEVAPTLAYGTDLIPNMGIGVALKLVRVDLAPAVVTTDQVAGRGTTFAADFGWLYKIPSWKAAMGATLSNIGPDIAFVDEEQSDPLGRNVRVGVAYAPFETEAHRFTVSADAVRFLLPGRILAIDQWGVGGEYEFNRIIALRAGYYSDPIGDIEDVTFGLGLGYRGFRFDFASFPQASTLDRVKRFSVGYHF